MSRKGTLKLLGTIVLSYVIIGIAAGLVSAQLIARQEYQNTSQLIGGISDTYPKVVDSLMQALKEPNNDDFAAGNAVLKKYNYSTSTFWLRNAAVMTGTALVFLLIPTALLSAVCFLQYKSHKARIDGLTAYLESVNLGRDTLLLRQEDDFSHLEDEIYKTVTELRQSKENALRERQSLADNLADISHQLKTPITSMSLMTQLLSDNRNEEDAVYLEKLDNQLMRLEALVSSLLTLSKLDAGTLELERKPIDVYSMLLRAAEPVEDVIHQRNQQIVIQSEPEAHFTGDEAWTAEAFLNLIKNCSEHTPKGGTISIRYEQNPLCTEIIVEDSGKGFEKDDLPHIFQRFYKGKNSLKDSAGIGLALSKSIITRQNGTIRAENISGGGARFVTKFYFCHRNVTLG